MIVLNMILACPLRDNLNPGLDLDLFNVWSGKGTLILSSVDNVCATVKGTVSRQLSLRYRI